MRSKVFPIAILTSSFVLISIGISNANGPTWTFPYMGSPLTPGPDDLFSLSNPGTGAAARLLATGLGPALDVTSTGNGTAANFAVSNPDSTNYAGFFSNGGRGPAVYSVAQRGDGLHGFSYATNGVWGYGAENGVVGQSTAGTGVFAQSQTGVALAAYGDLSTGVSAYSNQAAALAALSYNGNGAQGVSINGTGVYGVSLNSVAVVGYSYAGRAGSFQGNVEVIGTLTKSAGSFKIDHPLDAANKYLSHSFVESPDMKNIYDGMAVLDARGNATVQLPDWFEALNRDFRYQLTAVGGAAPNLHVARGVAGNRFSIAGGYEGIQVSWQVTGIRHDPYAERHRIPVEEDKPAAERGTFLHPEVRDQPPERGLYFAEQQRAVNPQLQLRDQQAELQLHAAELEEQQEVEISGAAR